MKSGQSYILLLVITLFLVSCINAAPPPSSTHLQRVNLAHGKLKDFNFGFAQQFCRNYLHGRKPSSPVTTVTKTTTTTLAPKVTTIVQGSSTTTQNIAATTTSITTLSTVKATSTVITVTNTPTTSVTSTTTVTITTTEGTLRKRQSPTPELSYPNQLPSERDGEGGGGIISQQQGVQKRQFNLGGFIDREITDACLLFLYGRITNPTQTVTSTSTVTSTPPVQTSTRAAGVVTVTSTSTTTVKSTVTSFTSTSTQKNTVTVTGKPVTSVVTTDTETVTSTVVPTPPSGTTTRAHLMIGRPSASPTLYLYTDGDFVGSGRSFLLSASDDVQDADQFTFDSKTGLISVTTNPTYTSATFSKDPDYYFRMAESDAYNPQNNIVCTKYSDSTLLNCKTSEGYDQLQFCEENLRIDSNNECNAPMYLYLVPLL